MPQLTLKLSQNINLSLINFQVLFQKIHAALGKVNNLDINACHSGVIQEDYSYIGLGDAELTKIYLEVLWLENPERVAIKNELAQTLMLILQETLAPSIAAQGLKYAPRIRMGNLGTLGQDYYIHSRI